jgi:glycosyltransferase involved in cell wall biosynthesis
MQNITFSILMANYNNAKFIQESIESVISQSYNDWELVIVDDCSTDNSMDIIKPYLKDKRIKVILHKKNHGYGGTLRTAAANSTMSILAILDADDKLTNDALKTIASTYLKNQEAGFIYSTMWVCDSDLNPIQISQWIGSDVPPKTNLINPRVSHLKTFQRELYLKTTGFYPHLRIACDKDIIFKMEEITNFYYIDKPLYFYRIHEAGVSQGKKRFQARIELYITRCMSYQRRVNTTIPNLTLKFLYKEYFKITFHKLILFTFKLIRYLKIRIIVKKLSGKFHFIKNMIQKNEILKKLIDI